MKVHHDEHDPATPLSEGASLVPELVAGGSDVDLAAGDVLVMPAGVSHISDERRVRIRGRKARRHQTHHDPAYSEPGPGHGRGNAAVAAGAVVRRMGPAPRRTRSGLANLDAPTFVNRARDESQRPAGSRGRSRGRCEYANEAIEQAGIDGNEWGRPGPQAQRTIGWPL